jgi:hypothetical protein
VSSALFYHWRKSLGIQAINPVSAPSSPSANFIDLGAVKDPAVGVTRKLVANDAMPHSAIELRIELGGGVVLTIVRH